jgi:predicted dehydrogenase
MRRIAVIGAGAHSREHHLPALARLKKERPTDIALAMVCDRDTARAASAADRFGFESFCADVEEILRSPWPDAVLVLTPPAAIRAVAQPFIERGIPLLIEKPPGATPLETREIIATARAFRAPVMVSMNRRFDPALAAGQQWLAGRRFRSARGAMRRQRRTEPGFAYETGVHALDALIFLAGAPVRAEAQRLGRDKSDGWVVELEFAHGAAGRLELLPACGVLAERFEFEGEGWSLELHAAGQDDGRLCARENDVKTRDEFYAEGAPPYVRSGAWNETLAFLEALEGRRPFCPAPEDVLPALDILYPLGS